MAFAKAFVYEIEIQGGECMQAPIVNPPLKKTGREVCCLDSAIRDCKLCRELDAGISALAPKITNLDSSSEIGCGNGSDRPREDANHYNRVTTYHWKDGP